MPKDPLWYVIGLIGTALSGTIATLWKMWQDERTDRAKDIAVLNIEHAKEVASLRSEHAKEITVCTEARFAVVEERRRDAEKNGQLLAKVTDELQQTKAFLAVLVEREKR